MFRRLMPRLLGVAAVLALAWLAMPALSRPAADEDEKALGDVPSDLKLVPRDAVMFVSARAADASETISGKAALVFGEFGFALGMAEEQFGLVIEDVERATLFVRRHEPVIIVRTAKPLDKDRLLRRFRAEEVKAHGKTFLVSAGGWRPQAIWIADERTAVFAQADQMVPYLAVMEKAGKTHPFADELKAAAGNHHVTFACLPEKLTRTLAAAERLREEGWKKGGPRDFRFKDEGMKKDPVKIDGFRKDDDFKDKDGFKEKEKFGAKAEFLPVRLQKEFGFKEKGREPRFDPSEVKEEPLKLGTLEEACEYFDRWGPMTAPFRCVMRGKRAFATLDFDAKMVGGKAAAAVVFATEDDAKDGAVAGEAAKVWLGELAAMPLRHGFKGLKSIEAAVKEARTALRAAEVKRDGKTVTVSLGGTIDFLPAMLDAMRMRHRRHMHDGPPGWHEEEMPYKDGPRDRGKTDDKGKFEDFPKKDEKRFIDKEK